MDDLPNISFTEELEKINNGVHIDPKIAQCVAITEALRELTQRFDLPVTETTELYYKVFAGVIDKNNETRKN